MKKVIYYKRIADSELKFRLSVKGAVLILGPKYCGKTTTASKFAKTIIKMKDPDLGPAYLETAKTKPSNLLIGDNPLLIDEWQISLNIYDAVRTSCDDRNIPGLYILTGSNSFALEKDQHTGTGRINRYIMYPMSLFESQESNGLISLKDVFDGKFLEGAKSTLDLNDVIYAACRGGWPSSLLLNGEREQLFIAKDYFESICNCDMNDVDKRERDPNKTRAILKSYARNISTLALDSTIIADVNCNLPISRATYEDYIKTLKKLFIIQNLEAWCPSIRSRESIRSTEKKEFVDPSIAVAALGIGPEMLKKDLKTFGFIFECLCIRDLRIYSQSLNGRLNYYRDSLGLEADAVLTLEDGRYALIEFKLGQYSIDEGAKHLLSIKKLVEKQNIENKNNKVRLPDELWIIYAGPISYIREDGVKVIPIGCLKD